MNRIPLVLAGVFVSLLLTLGVSTTAGTAATTGKVKCGKGFYANDIYVHKLRGKNVSCKVAKNLAKAYTGSSDCYLMGCRTKGYKCKRKVIGYETYRATCRRDEKKVRFNYGV